MAEEFPSRITAAEFATGGEVRARTPEEDWDQRLRRSRTVIIFGRRRRYVGRAQDNRQRTLPQSRRRAESNQFNDVFDLQFLQKFQAMLAYGFGTYSQSPGDFLAPFGSHEEFHDLALAHREESHSPVQVRVKASLPAAIRVTIKGALNRL
jgi:hypothetical protein